MDAFWNSQSHMWPNAKHYRKAPVVPVRSEHTQYQAGGFNVVADLQWLKPTVISYVVLLVIFEPAANVLLCFAHLKKSL